MKSPKGGVIPWGEEKVRPFDVQGEKEEAKST